MCVYIFEKNLECNCLKFSSLYDLKLALDFSCSKKESLLVKNEFKKRKEREQASFSYLELGSYTDAVCSVMSVHCRYNSIWLEVGLKMWDFLELASEITIYLEIKVFRRTNEWFLGQLPLVCLCLLVRKTQETIIVSLGKRHSTLFQRSLE